MATLIDKLADEGIRIRNPVRGANYTTCPQCSDDRKAGNRTKPCLSVKIDDDGTGCVWNCHNCGWHGNVAGQSGAPAGPPPEKQVRKPPEPIAPRHPLKMYQWFAKRGIGREVVDEAEIYVKNDVWFPQVSTEKPALVFPYRYRGELVNNKYRMIGPEKHFRQDKDALKTLYGIDSLIEDDVCIWVEGEPDLLAMRQAGYNQVVSLPDGAPPEPKKDAPPLSEDEQSRRHDRRLAPLALHADRLHKIERHLIGTDMDGPGETLAAELARRLGPQRCWRIRWPRKDANDVLREDGADTVRRCVDDAVPWPVNGIQDVAPDDLVRLRSEKGETLYATGLRNLDALVRWPVGRLVIVTGTPGHGKSELMDALMVAWAQRYGWTFGLYSAENETLQHASSLAEKHMGRPFRNYGPNMPDPMTDAELREAERWVRGHFHWIRHDDDEPLGIDTILEAGEVLLLRHGIRGLLIDPYNEVDHARGRDQTETEYVSALLSRCRRFARRHACNVFIVAHPQKPPPSAKPPVPGLYDISGGAHWFNKADIGIAVHRPDRDQPRANVWVHKVKRKWWGRRGMADLWWGKSTGQYFDTEEDMQNEETKAYGDTRLVV